MDHRIIGMIQIKTLSMDTGGKNKLEVAEGTSKKGAAGVRDGSSPPLPINKS